MCKTEFYSIIKLGPSIQFLKAKKRPHSNVSETAPDSKRKKVDVSSEDDEDEVSVVENNDPERVIPRRQSETRAREQDRAVRRMFGFETPSVPSLEELRDLLQAAANRSLVSYDHPIWAEFLRRTREAENFDELDLETIQTDVIENLRNQERQLRIIPSSQDPQDSPG